MTIALTTLFSLRGPTASGTDGKAAHGPEFKELIDQISSARVAPATVEGLGSQSGLKMGSLLASELLDLMPLSAVASAPSVATPEAEPTIVGSNAPSAGADDVTLGAANEAGMVDGMEGNGKMAALLALLARPAPTEPAPEALGNSSG